MTAVLYLVMVVAWGFTWFAIKLQLGPVPPEISICYRFALAAALLWAGLALSGRLRAVRPAQHRWFALLGATLFGLNFILIYQATQHIASGIVSVLFTTATVFNGLNQWLFDGRRPSAQVMLGGALGMAGIALLFSQQLAQFEANRGSALGILLALGGTYVFSLGNLVSIRVTRDGTDLLNGTARGMAWGTGFLALFALARGEAFVIDLSPRYLISLAYLALIGSVLGFIAYLSLIRRVGPDRAAYATVLFPVVALTVSTLLEGYVWTGRALVGLPLILAGNLVIFVRPRRRALA